MKTRAVLGRVHVDPSTKPLLHLISALRLERMLKIQAMAVKGGDESSITPYGCSFRLLL